MCVFPPSVRPQVESCVRESRAFLLRCKKAHRDTTTPEGLEREFGVTEALVNPPTPPADRPDVKSYTAARNGGGGASATGGGGGGKEASGSGGGSVAAGIAPGGEAGISAAGVGAAAGAAAAAAATKWKGNKGKKGKGDDVEDKIPELVKASEKKGGKGLGGGGGVSRGPGLPPGLTGGGRGPEIGIGGLFGGRSGRANMGPGAGNVPLGMMGGRGMTPSTFSGAASSFNGSTHSSMNGMGGGGQMGDPRLHMSQPHMGMAPAVNPSTGLPPGMTQNGPPLVLPLGMVPPGGGPPVINQPPAPSVMDQSMMGSMGGRGPGGGWDGGPQPGGWGGGGLQPTRSFGRFVQKPGVRQQGFRRSSSFGDMNMGGPGPSDDSGYPPGYRGRRLSPMMEDDGFDTASTRSAPVFGATAAVGEAAAAAEAASAAAARVAAGGHVAESKKSSGAEESKSSSKKREGRGVSPAAAAAGAAAAAAAGAAAAVAAAPSPAPSPPLPPSEPVHVPVTIEAIHPKKETAPATASAVSVTTAEQTNNVAEPTSAPISSTMITHVEVPAASSATPSATDASPARATVTTVSTAAAVPAAPAAPASPVYLSDRGDDGGLSRYGTSGETPARIRSKPMPTWKRMMSIGSASSGRSYRYDGGDMGVSGETKPSAEEMFDGDRWRKLSYRYVGALRYSTGGF